MAAVLRFAFLEVRHTIARRSASGTVLLPDFVAAAKMKWIGVQKIGYFNFIVEKLSILWNNSIIFIPLC